MPSEYPWCEPHLEVIGEFFRDFTARKRRSGLLDFDDLLLYWRALLGHEEIGPHLANRFRYVLVDEYQDVNSLQVDIVRLWPRMAQVSPSWATKPRPSTGSVDPILTTFASWSVVIQIP